MEVCVTSAGCSGATGMIGAVQRRVVFSGSIFGVVGVVEPLGDSLL